MSKVQKQVNQELAQEVDEWGDYLMADLEARVRNNKNRPLSQRQLKKTTNGNITYERLVRVLGLGSPDRLEQIMLSMARTEKLSVETSQTESESKIPITSKAPIAITVDTHDGRNEPSIVSQKERALQPRGRRKRWDKSALLQFLWVKYQELGRIPTQKEIQDWSKAKSCPSYVTWMKLLDNRPKTEWEELLLGGHVCY